MITLRDGAKFSAAVSVFFLSFFLQFHVPNNFQVGRWISKKKHYARVERAGNKKGQVKTIENRKKKKKFNPM